MLLSRIMMLRKTTTNKNEDALVTSHFGQEFSFKSKHSVAADSSQKAGKSQKFSEFAQRNLVFFSVRLLFVLLCFLNTSIKRLPAIFLSLFSVNDVQIAFLKEIPCVYVQLLNYVFPALIFIARFCANSPFSSGSLIFLTALSIIYV